MPFEMTIFGILSEKIYFRKIEMKMSLSKLLKYDILKYHTSLSLNL